MIELGRDVEMVDNDLLNCRFNQIEGEVFFLLIVLGNLRNISGPKNPLSLQPNELGKNVFLILLHFALECSFKVGCMQGSLPRRRF